MAKYNITSLNYMASGSNRNFINMDVELDQEENRLYDYVHLLALEHKNWNGPCLSGDVLLEQRSGKYVGNEYISYEFQYLSSSSDEYQTKCVVNAASHSKIPAGLLLKENSTLYVEDKEHRGQYIRLYLSCCTDTELARLKKFIEDSYKPGKIYEIELNQLNTDINTVYNDGERVDPLYDMNDVCIKSMNTKQNHLLENFDLSMPTKTQDVYIPEDSKPVQFCQIGPTVYIMTGKTKHQCDRLFSDIRKSSAESGGYKMKLEQHNMKTYLYPSRSDLAAVSDEENQTYRRGLNIYQTSDARELYGSASTENFFKPAVNLDGLQYNYIAAAPASDVQSEYNNGNVYADMYITKNMYNSTYSMEMSSQTSIQNCRDYIDLIECGGKLYLKYYDNINYSGSILQQPEALSDLTKVRNVEVHARQTGYPYQKIEEFHPISLRSASNHHKSFFFSVQIADINIDDVASSGDMTESEKAETKKLLDSIKFDIKTSIKEIAENVSPANTQLFDVYFGNSI